MSTKSVRFILDGLLTGFVLFSLFIPAFQVQAVPGAACSTTIACIGGNCINGICTGPCISDAECTAVATPLGWGGGKCTGTADNPNTPADERGVCLELPRSGSQLPVDVPETGAQLLSTVDTVTNWVFAVFVVLSIIFVLLAAFQFVTAGGEATKVGEARQKLIWAAVGIVIALLAKGLVPVVKSIIGG